MKKLTNRRREELLNEAEESGRNVYGLIKEEIGYHKQACCKRCLYFAELSLLDGQSAYYCNEIIGIMSDKQAEIEPYHICRFFKWGE